MSTPIIAQDGPVANPAPDPPAWTLAADGVRDAAGLIHPRPSLIATTYALLTDALAAAPANPRAAALYLDQAAVRAGYLALLGDS